MGRGARRADLATRLKARLRTLRTQLERRETPDRGRARGQRHARPAEGRRPGWCVRRDVDSGSLLGGHCARYERPAGRHCRGGSDPGAHAVAVGGWQLGHAATAPNSSRPILRTTAAPRRRDRHGHRVSADLPPAHRRRARGPRPGSRRPRSLRRSVPALALAFRTILEPPAIALDNALALQKAEALSVTDDLTRLYNSRYLNHVLRREIEARRRAAAGPCRCCSSTSTASSRSTTRTATWRAARRSSRPARSSGQRPGDRRGRPGSAATSLPWFCRIPAARAPCRWPNASASGSAACQFLALRRSVRPFDRLHRGCDPAGRGCIGRRTTTSRRRGDVPGQGRGQERDSHRSGGVHLLKRSMRLGSRLVFFPVFERPRDRPGHRQHLRLRPRARASSSTSPRSSPSTRSTAASKRSARTPRRCSAGRRATSWRSSR